MCCFSQAVEVVSDTNIFVRSHNDRQFLVYSMSYASYSDLAMILPLPVPAKTSEDAVQFINLQSYPTFFEDIRQGFPPRWDRSASFFRSATPLGTPKLRVHDVGDFEASFVPQISDFERLDRRFRIAPDVWGRLPVYHDYGFAVFKLKGTASSRWITGALRRLFRGSARNIRELHPMAFTFPRRNSDLLYFPTVHVHDRKVHRHAEFDHMLYCQPDFSMQTYLDGWERSVNPAQEFMDVPKSEGIIDPLQSIWRLPLEGQLENTDTLVGKNGVLPEGVKLNEIRSGPLPGGKARWNRPRR